MMREAPQGQDESGGVGSRLRTAFPRHLAVDVDAALAVLPIAQHPPTTHDIGPIVLDGEAIHIPYRIYSAEPEPSVAANLTDLSQAVLSCLFTRHHDGLVRERRVRQLLSAEGAWIPPYVLQLIGEYVVEIVEYLLDEVDHLRSHHYSAFAATNEVFIRGIRHRVISYWHCYYRSRYPRLDEYPGFRVMNELSLWDRHDARRQLARCQRRAGDGASRRP
jgi:hypothetical protein